MKRFILILSFLFLASCAIQHLNSNMEASNERIEANTKMVESSKNAIEANTEHVMASTKTLQWVAILFPISFLIVLLIVLYVGMKMYRNMKNDK